MPCLENWVVTGLILRLGIRNKYSGCLYLKDLLITSNNSNKITYINYLYFAIKLMYSEHKANTKSEKI